MSTTGAAKRAENGRDQEFGYATEDLTSDKHYDLMILPTIIGWNHIRRKCGRPSRAAWRDGAGLVLIAPQDCKEKLADEIIILPHSPSLNGASLTQYHWYGDWERQLGLGPRRRGSRPRTGEKPHRPRRLLGRDAAGDRRPDQDFKLAGGATLVAKPPTRRPSPRARGSGPRRRHQLVFGTVTSTGLTPVRGREPSARRGITGSSSTTCWAEPPSAAPARARSGRRVRRFQERQAQRSRSTTACTRSTASLLADLSRTSGRIVAQRHPATAPPGAASKHEIAVTESPGGTNHLEVIAAGRLPNLGWGGAQVNEPMTCRDRRLTVARRREKWPGDQGRSNVKGADGTVRCVRVCAIPSTRFWTRKHERGELRRRRKVAYSSGPKTRSRWWYLCAEVLMEARPSGKRLSRRGCHAGRARVHGLRSHSVGLLGGRDLWEVKAAAYRKFNAARPIMATPEAWLPASSPKGHAEPPPRTRWASTFNAGAKGRLKQFGTTTRKPRRQVAAYAARPACPIRKRSRD